MFGSKRLRVGWMLTAFISLPLFAGCGKHNRSGSDSGGGSSTEYVTRAEPVKMKENFEKVKEGMPIAEVVALLGSPLDAVPGMETMPAMPGMKSWLEDDVVYIVMFANDKVAVKTTQPKPKANPADSKEKSRPITQSKLTRENFDKIKLGMSRKEVESIIGHGGKVESTTSVTGTKAVKMIWREGKKIVQIMFEDDKVTLTLPSGL